MMIFEITHHAADIVVPIIVLILIFYILFLKRRMFLMSLREFQLSRQKKYTQKNLRKEQDQSQMRLDAIELALDGIAIISPKGDVVYGNRALWNIFDVPHHKKSLFLKKSWLNLYGEKGRAHIHEHVLPALDQKGEWRGQGPVQLHNGFVIYGEMTLKRIEGGNIIGVIRDISERILSEQEQEQNRAAMWQNNKALAMGRMARGMVHDINNSLASIMGYAEFLSDDLDHESDQGRYVRAILESTHRISYILDQVSVLAPKPTILPDQCEAISVLRALLMRQEFFQRCDIDLPMTHAVVPLSKNHFQKLVEEILKNALESGTAQKIRIYASNITGDSYSGLIPVGSQKNGASDYLPMDIQLSSQNRELNITLGALLYHKSYLCIRVIDTGKAIHADDAEMIFDPFFSHKSPQHHPGLGLAVVRGLLTLYGGALHLHSKHGQGTDVHIFLPRDSSEVIIQDDIPENDIQLTGKHIVIIDDQIAVLDQLSEFLKRQKMRVSSFTDGLEALDFICAQYKDIDLVITDHQMPVISGGELAAELKADFSDMPIILMSGFNPDPLPTHIDSFIKKPIASAELRHILARLIGKKTKP